MSSPKNPRFLVRHLGNMGDFVFLIPPFLATLKRRYPDCHTTLVTSWGYKHIRGTWAKKWLGEPWGERNLGGQSIHLAMTNPHIDELVHYHDTKLSLEKEMCYEDGQRFATWSASHYEQQKKSGEWDRVFELDFGITATENPLQHLYEYAGFTDEDFSEYKLYFSEADRAIAEEIMAEAPRPRIVLLESLVGETTRAWNTDLKSALESAIHDRYGVAPFWFGGAFTPDFWGKPLTLRQNIALLTHCDVGIGVLSGPLHFAAAVGLPTLTLYCDQAIERAAPAYFLNRYITDTQKRHRTLVGPDPKPLTLLKSDTVPHQLTPAEQAAQDYRGWAHPGKQRTKSCLAVLSIDEVMHVLDDMLPRQN